MAVLFEEVVLGDKDVVIPELIGELDLLQRFVVYLEFVLLVPLVGIEWFGRLQLEVNAEFHALLSLLKAQSVRGAPGCPGYGYAPLIRATGSAVNRGEILGYSVGALLSGLWHNMLPFSLRQHSGS